jgi:flagellar biogenesis protein FliO
MAGTFKIFLAIMCAIVAMIIIGIAIVMKLSNSGLMYQ